jgi:hypothetical protein
MDNHWPGIESAGGFILDGPWGTWRAPISLPTNQGFLPGENCKSHSAEKIAVAAWMRTTASSRFGFMESQCPVIVWQRSVKKIAAMVLKSS